MLFQEMRKNKIEKGGARQTIVTHLIYRKYIWPFLNKYEK